MHVYHSRVPLLLLKMYNIENRLMPKSRCKLCHLLIQHIQTSNAVCTELHLVTAHYYLDHLQSIFTVLLCKNTCLENTST